MRFYPTGDISHYWEYPSSWSMYCRTPKKSWRRETYEPKHSIAYWRDLEGQQKGAIMQKDLFFKDWPSTRIRMQACLPQYYSVGNRFVNLEKLFPSGFKCQVLPLNLQQARAVNAYEKQKEKEERLKLKEEKRLAKERAKAERKKSRIKR